jgi:hypothetical protein
MLRVLPIPFENDVRRRRFDEVLSRAHQQGRVLASESRTANVCF